MPLFPHITFGREDLPVRNMARFGAPAPTGGCPHLERIDTDLLEVETSENAAQKAMHGNHQCQDIRSRSGSTPDEKAQKNKAGTCSDFRKKSTT